MESIRLSHKKANGRTSDSKKSGCFFHTYMIKYIVLLKRLNVID